MEIITGKLIQNDVPTPSNPVPVEIHYKAIINGKEYDLGKGLDIEEIYKKDDKWYIRKG